MPAAISIGGVLMGLLHVALYCAIVIFVAFCIVWLLKWLGVTIDGQVYTWGRVIVALLCIIAVVAFLLSLIPGTGVSVPLLLRP